MDDMARRFVYDEVLIATRDYRKKLLETWVDFGETPSKSEDKEIDSEMNRLGRAAGHAAALAHAAIQAAHDRIEFIEMLNAADDRGMQVVQADDDDDDDEDEESAQK